MPQPPDYDAAHKPACTPEAAAAAPNFCIA
jgi:hypothetical protein